MKSHISFRIASAALLVASIALAPLLARAGDGVLEINQACIAAGCFPGDTPGFPVTTATGQSYRLTSPITVPSNADGIEVAAAASLDLAGFAVQGPISCSGSPASCTGSLTTRVGVELERGASLRNGTVRGTSGFGVFVKAGSTVENVFVEQNGKYGIGGTADGAIVRNCRVLANGEEGINFSLGSGSPGALITNSTIQSNGGHGIRAAEVAVIANTVTDNGGLGLALNLVTQDGGFAQNVIRSNNGGNANAQTAGGFEIGTNVCGTDTTCP